MSSPEASIEEILASIRKTFTDDTDGQGAKPAASAPEPRATGMPSFRSANETPVAAFNPTPLPTPPKSRAAAIDDELDDLIDKPAPKIAAPKLAEPANVPQPAPPPAAAITPVEAAREKWANLLNPSASAPKAAESKIELPPQPAPVTPAPTSSPTPSSGLFAPRKGGFYPPQDVRPDPILPMPPASPSAADDTATPTPQPSAAPASVAEPATAPIASPAPRPGFIPFPQPAIPVVPEPAPVAVAPAPAPVADVPAASARALDDLVADLNNAAKAPAEPAAPAPIIQPAPIAAPTAVAAPAPAPLALAAAPSPAPVAPEPPVPPVPLSAPTPLAPAVAAAEPSAPASSGRSFEDVVADMLRPLLEKWIDENMPRIVERALQRDATLTRKSNS